MTTVTPEPHQCFVVESYRILDSDGLVPSYISIDQTGLTFEIQTTDKTLSDRTITYSIEAGRLKNGSMNYLEIHTFDIEFLDQCLGTQIIETTVDAIEYKPADSSSIEVRIDLFEDTVSQSNGVVGLCGGFSYNLSG
jgi:hypothetical protein